MSSLHWTAWVVIVFYATTAACFQAVLAGIDANVNSNTMWHERFIIVVLLGICSLLWPITLLFLLYKTAKGEDEDGVR